MATLQSVTSSIPRLGLTLPPAPTLPNEEAYRELTRRLKGSEQFQIMQKISEVTDVKLDQLISALNEAHWEDPIFKDENYPYVALAAVRKGRISVSQFATVMFYWVNFSKENVSAQVVSLFLEGGAINPEARKLIHQTLILKPLQIPFETNLSLPENTCLLTEEEIDKLFEEMRKLPVSEQCFFLKKEKELPEIVKVIQAHGLNVFYQTEEGMMIPSLGLMQAYLNVKYGSDAVKINPVLGYSSEEDKRQNGLTGMRDMAIHFPWTLLPYIADRVKAPWYSLSWHDFYHAMLASCVREKYRHLFIKLADLSEDYSKQQKLPLARTMSEVLIDMEMNVFRKELNPVSTMNKLFWANIAGRYIVAKMIMNEANAFDVHLRPIKFYCPTEEEKEFIEKFISWLPLDNEYNEGNLATVEEVSKKYNEQIETKKTNEFLACFLPPNEMLEYMRDENIHVVLHKAWQRRLEGILK